MSDVINAACAALRRATRVLREQVVREFPSDAEREMLNTADECEKALADLRLMTSGDERWRRD
jgi:hypothetical protein